MKKEEKNGKIVIKISIMWLFVLGIIIALLISFFRNYIFATNRTSIEEEEKTIETIPVIEENQNAVDIVEIMVQNNYSNKKVVNEIRDIKYETKRQETEKLPKGEEEVAQKGIVGKENVKAVQEYKDEVLISEQIVERIVEQEPVTEIINVGTSEFLSKYSVHIGDEMYLIESGELRKEKENDSEKICSINRYLNVELIEVSKDWAKVRFDAKEGYIEISKLTSEAVTPKIKEKNRIAKLQQTLSIDMNLNKESGLTLSDYKTIFAYNESDKNGIFSENAETFYNIEQKYKINGIFLASIGIHESAWGTSKIAKEKYNLFGYKAYDKDPEEYAQMFTSYEECIDIVASALVTNYLSSDGKYYNGATLEGVNTKYASDQEWHTKVYKYMEYLYDKLG